MRPARSTVIGLALGGALAAVLVIGASVFYPPTRAYYRAMYYDNIALVHGMRRDHDVMVAMRDGVRLATDIYRPDGHGEAKLSTILVRLPYDKDRYGGAVSWARTYVPRGYAVVLQDMRGRFASQGVFTPYDHAIDDGSDTLDWIARQDWSNGRVATAGCSALGESQAILAKARHPNHRAMIVESGGGAIGGGGRSRGYFAFFEGGVPTLAAMFGWFLAHGGKTADSMGGPDLSPIDVLGGLPSGTLVSRHRQSPTDYEDFMARFEESGYWKRLGYLDRDDRFAAPALHVTTWHDTGVQGAFEVAELMRENATTDEAREHQHLIVGPGLHCDFAGAFLTGMVGDLEVSGAARFDFDALYAQWLAHWLEDADLPKLAPVTYFVLGANRWKTAASWPPPGASMRSYYLGVGGRLDGEPAPGGTASYRYDPAHPTPSLGGAICCTGEPDLRAGPLDQSPNEARDDLLAFRSAPLDEALTIAGTIRATLSLSSDAPDTDIVATLLDIREDGRLLAIQQGVQRLRYRDGFDAPRLLEPGQTVSVAIDFPPIAYRIAEGSRIGLHIASAAFPRLERNLNTGRANHLETDPRIAVTTLRFGGRDGSRITLPVAPEEPDAPACPPSIADYCG